ncbi:glycoside hydrolase family 20 zincin-like fold domain-containing protein [Deinococcus sp. UYEF24]
MRRPHLILLAALLLAPVAAQNTVQPTLSVSDAVLHAPPAAVTPTPTRATYPAGVLPLAGLGLELRPDASGTVAPELAWAARDLQTEWQTRLGLALPTGGQPGGSDRRIVIGTRADPALAALASKAGLLTDRPESYALIVNEGGATIVGADAAGAYHGAQTLAQLLTAGGLRYAQISDAPAVARRVAMIYLDSTSQGVNDRLIPLLARLKYNAVLVMSDYVQWDTAKAGGYTNPQGATKAEAARVAELARTHGLEVIPLIETLSHVNWMFQNGKNLDLVQDPQGQANYAYDTLNPETYTRVILPILKEAVEVFHPKVIHIGHDEVRNRDRFPARPNGVAAGFETLYADDTRRLHDALAGMGVATMIWHDVAFSDSLIATLPAKLPKDVQVAYWNYLPSPTYPALKTIQALGFSVLGAAWADPNNPEVMGQSAARSGAGYIQTRWNGYFGNPSIWDGAASQGVAYVRGAQAAWNPAAPLTGAPEATYRDLYQPTPDRAQAGTLIDLSPYVTRTLNDPDGKGWIGKGAGTDLSALPTGNVRLGDTRYLIGGAVMLRGTRANVAGLPERAEIALNRRVSAVNMLLTTPWPTPADRDKVGSVIFSYQDGQSVTQPLQYGRHLRAWSDLSASSMVPAPAWTGKTKDGLDVNLTTLSWTNPRPDVAVKSVTLLSDGTGASLALLGLTTVEAGK